MITKTELRALNEALKCRSLSSDEWAEIDAYVKSKGERIIKEELELEYPLLSIKYKPTKAGYKIFLDVVCDILNESEKFINNLYKAKVENAEYGDGSGLCLRITGTRGVIAMVSALDDFLKANEQNGGSSIDRFVEALLNTLPNI